MENGGMELDLITEPKAVSNGQTTLQVYAGFWLLPRHFKSNLTLHSSRLQPVLQSSTSRMRMQSMSLETASYRSRIAQISS